MVKTRVRANVLLAAGMVLALAVGALTMGGAANGADPSFSSYRVAGCAAEVVGRGNVIAIAPSGGEDTRNLQCAIDAAIAAGRPMTLSLASGTFKTAQLVAKGFVGHLRGGGRNSTIVTNVARPVLVTPVDMFLAGEPSATNPWPSLIAFVGGDFQVSDLTIRITGEAPTTGWSIFGISPPIKAFAHAFVILGQRANAQFQRLVVEGAPAPGDLLGLNVINGIFFEGFLADLAPISGTFEVRGSTFRSVASGVPAGNVRNGEIRIIGNQFESVLFGGEAFDLANVTYTYTGNHVQTDFVGVQMYDSCLGTNSVCGFERTTLLVAGNEITSPGDGVEILATFKRGTVCSVVGNKIQYGAAAGAVAVWLGPGTSNCLVVTRGAVKDEGTGNKVITIP